MARACPLLLYLDCDPSGLLLRHAVLETAGYDTVSTANAELALAVLATLEVAIVVIAGETTELAKRCKQVQPQARVLLLSARPTQPDVAVDRQVLKLDGPRALIAAIAELVADRGRGQPPQAESAGTHANARKTKGER